MNLDTALRQIARDGGLDANELIAYAAEDKVGGRDTWHGEPTFSEPTDWSGMSTFAAEGQILYALIRAMKPRQVIEIGVDSGGTTTHILSALHINDYGELFSVDIKEDVGQKIPDHLRYRWTLHVGDALTADLPDAEFVFEDGPHDYEWTKAMLSRLKAMNPRAIFTHDMYTHLTYPGGFDVQRAFVDAIGVDQGVIIPPSIAGLGYWFREVSHA